MFANPRRFSIKIHTFGACAHCSAVAMVKTLRYSLNAMSISKKAAQGKVSGLGTGDRVNAG
jgi:hypothetical protein